MKVGDFVKVVKVIQVNDDYRNAKKTAAIGDIFRIRGNACQSARYDGHVYQLEYVHGCDRVDFFFHADELELVTGSAVSVPPIGAFVRLSDGSIAEVDLVLSVIVSDKNGKVGRVASVLSAEECETHRQALAAAAKEKIVKETEALLKERDDMIAAANNALNKVTDINTKLALLKAK